MGRRQWGACWIALAGFSATAWAAEVQEAVAANLYRPLLQVAVLLKKGQGDPAATALLSYLKSDQAQAVIRAYGYEL